MVPDFTGHIEMPKFDGSRYEAMQAAEREKTAWLQKQALLVSKINQGIPAVQVLNPREKFHISKLNTTRQHKSPEEIKKEKQEASQKREEFNKQQREEKLRIQEHERYLQEYRE